MQLINLTFLQQEKIYRMITLNISKKISKKIYNISRTNSINLKQKIRKIFKIPKFNNINYPTITILIKFKIVFSKQIMSKRSLYLFKLIRIQFNNKQRCNQNKNKLLITIIPRCQTKLIRHIKHLIYLKKNMKLSLIQRRSSKSIL